MAGDPDAETSLRVIQGLPAAGADIIELGFAFSDPMADGPAIQRAALRALAAGMTLQGTLDLARRFRSGDRETPIVLMGYMNPILSYGLEPFAAEAADAGVDGVIIVDCPPEEADPVLAAFDPAGLALIRLATPTTDDARLPTVVRRTSGFVYYVAVTGGDRRQVGRRRRRGPCGATECAPRRACRSPSASVSGRPNRRRRWRGSPMRRWSARRSSMRWPTRSHRTVIRSQRFWKRLRRSVRRCVPRALLGQLRARHGFG